MVASVLSAASLGALACSAAPPPESAIERESPPRRPDGVWLEPAVALPPAMQRAQAGGGDAVLALRTPVDRRQVLAVVHRFVDALVRDDERGAEALCAPSPNATVSSALRVRVLARSHDYTKLAGQRVFRDENVTYRRGNEDADGGARDAGESERDVIMARVLIDVPQAGGEVLFGSVLGLDLVEANGVLLIRDLDLNAGP